MNVIRAGLDFVLAINFVDANGSPVTGPDSASYTIVDHEGTELVASTALSPAPTDTMAAITIPAAVSELAVGQTHKGLFIELLFAKDGVQSIVQEEVIAEAAQPLQLLANSFQTYNTAVMVSHEISGIDSFAGATRQERIRALITGFQMLNTLTFIVGGKKRRDLTLLTTDEFNALTPGFLRALRTAQVIEANELLDPNSIHNKRQSGLLSESIGESSMFWRPEKVLLIPVTRRSLDVLRGWVTWELETGRG